MARKPLSQREKSRLRARELTRGLKQQLAIQRTAVREMARQLAELTEHLARLEGPEIEREKWVKNEGEIEARNGPPNRG